MKIKPKNYARSLVRLVEGKNKTEINKIVADFVQYLHDHQALHFGKQILSEFSKVYNQHHNIKTIKVDSAKVLTNLEKKLIEQTMAKRLNAKIELQNNVESDLLAGLQISWDDNLWDDTMSGKLKLMKKNLS